MDGKDLNDDGVRALCFGIIIRVVEDYMSAARYSNHSLKLECENFFRSPWFEMISEYDGEAILLELKARIVEEKIAKSKAKAGRKAFRIEKPNSRKNGGVRDDS